MDNTVVIEDISKWNISTPVAVSDKTSFSQMYQNMKKNFRATCIPSWCKKRDKKITNSSLRVQN